MIVLLLMIAVVLYTKCRGQTSPSLTVGDYRVVYTCGCAITISDGGARRLESACWSHHGMTLDEIYAKDRAERNARRALKNAERQVAKETQAAEKIVMREISSAHAAVEKAKTLLKKGLEKDAIRAAVRAEKLMDKAKADAEKLNRGSKGTGPIDG